MNEVVKSGTDRMMTVTSKQKREREINWCGDNLKSHTASSRATPPPTPTFSKPHVKTFVTEGLGSRYAIAQLKL